jgi:ABC-type multidrug transport system fused ATPase/permease subunit
LQNAIKYLLNMTKGRVLEDVARDLRQRVVGHIDRARQAAAAHRPGNLMDEGTAISILAAEVDDVGGFVSQSLAVPLLQVGTIVSVAGYLMWVEPMIGVFAVLIYLPQTIVVPRVQSVINRLAKTRIRILRKLGRNAVEFEGIADSLDSERRKRTKVLIDSAYSTRMRIYIRKFFLTFFGNVLDAVGPAMVLVVGGLLMIRGQTEIGTLVVFISGLHKLARPWDELVTFYRTATNARVSYGLIVEALAPASRSRPKSTSRSAALIEAHAARGAQEAVESS